MRSAICGSCEVCVMSTHSEHLQTDPGALPTITFKRKHKFSRNRGHRIYIYMIKKFYSFNDFHRTKSTYLFSRFSSEYKHLRYMAQQQSFY